PAPRQELKAFDPEWPLDDVDCPRPAMGECVSKLFAAIDPVGKDMPQLGKALSETLQQGDCAMDILDIGGMDGNGQQQAIGLRDDVPLAAIDTFARVKAAGPAGLRRRSALAVDNRSAWFRLTSELPPCLFDQSSDNPVPPAGIAPSIEIALHRRVWRELAWQ